MTAVAVANDRAAPVHRAAPLPLGSRAREFTVTNGGGRMVDDDAVMKRVAAQIATALSTSDLDMLGDLLDSDVRWGPPGEDGPACTSREQLLAWYRRGRYSGASAQVTETSVHGAHILVGLNVTSPAYGLLGRGVVQRWQVVSVHDGRVRHIVGFEGRDDAIEYLSRK